MPGFPQPDRTVGPVPLASRISAAAAVAAGVAAAFVAGHETEVDLIHVLEVNLGNLETTDGETCTNEGYYEAVGSSAAEETGTEGEAYTDGHGSA